MLRTFSRGGFTGPFVSPILPSGYSIPPGESVLGQPKKYNPVAAPQLIHRLNNPCMFSLWLIV